MKKLVITLMLAAATAFAQSNLPYIPQQNGTAKGTGRTAAESQQQAATNASGQYYGNKGKSVTGSTTYKTEKGYITILRFSAQ
jgi:hypothetical protein